MSDPSASQPAHKVRAALLNAALVLLVAVLFLGAIALGSAVVVLVQSPDVAVPSWLRVAVDAQAGASLGGAGVLAAIWVFFTVASIAASLLKPRDAAGWGGVVLLTDLAIYAQTGLLLASGAALIAALLAFAAAGPIFGLMSPPRPVARFSRLSIVETAPPATELPGTWPIEVPVFEEVPEAAELTGAGRTGPRTR